MQVQAMNNYALKRYEQFTGAMESVRVALEETDTVLRRMRDEHSGRFHGWQPPTKKEIVAARKKVTDLLDQFRAKAKDYEKELVSRGWRV